MHAFNTRTLLVLFLLVLSAGGATAVPIGPACLTCQGGIFDLIYTPVPGEENTFTLSFRADTTQYQGEGLYIDSVAIKPASSVSSFLLLSAPGGTDGWLSLLGGLDANSCSGAGSGFLCTESKASGAPLTTTVNEWVWQIETSPGSLLASPGEASVKVLFTDAYGVKVGDLVSEPITLSSTVPEPEASTLASLGLLLVALGHLRRKKRN